MKYMGSKNRYSKHLLPIILKDRGDSQWYVEPFVGGANMIDKVTGNCLGGEYNKYIAAMWIKLATGWFPDLISKYDYKNIKDNKDKYPEYLVGWVGIGCSYSGKWFGGFAGETMTKGGLRDYQKEALQNLKKQVPHILDTNFVHSSYEKLVIPPKSKIYCDPPYEGTTKYKDDFNHTEFWVWVRSKVDEGHQVYISEYNAPDDFVCIWQQEVKSSLSADGKSGGSKKSVEKLFVHESQYEGIKYN